jgi:HK97 family phage major capsid protein
MQQYRAKLSMLQIASMALAVPGMHVALDEAPAGTQTTPAQPNGLNIPSGNQPSGQNQSVGGQPAGIATNPSKVPANPTPAPQVQTPQTPPTGNANLDQVMQRFDANLQQTITQAVTPVVQNLQSQVDSLRGQLDQATQQNAQQHHAASNLFGGGAPAVRQGESVLCENRGYSFSRAALACQTGNWNNSKLEMDIHNRLHDCYDNMGGSTNGFLVPLAVEHMHGVDDSLRQEIGYVVRQGVSRLDMGEMMWTANRLQQQSMGRVNFDLSSWSDTSGGPLLGGLQHGELIDLLRAKEIVSRLGATEFTFPPNGRIVWPRVTGDMEGYWVGESQEITESDITTGGLGMVVKKLAAICDIPRDLIKFESISSEMLIRMSIAARFARKLDYSAIYGIGSEVAPKGILSYTGSETFATHTASTTDTDGDSLQPQDIALMVAKVAENNIDVDNSFAFVMRPLLHAYTKTRRADAVTAGDQAGPFVFQTEAVNEGPLSGCVGGYGVVDSTTVRNDRVKGAGTTLTEVIGGMWNELMIGRAGVIEFDLDMYSGTSGTNFKKDLVSIRGIQYVDTKPRRPEAFVHCDDLLVG